MDAGDRLLLRRLGAGFHVSPSVGVARGLCIA